jgi:hypothetical protein
MPQQDVTITAWPNDPVVVTHRTDPGETPQVDMNMAVRADRPVPVCFSLCEPICARSDYSIGVSIFENPVLRIRLVGETRIQHCGDGHERPPTRPDCVDLATLKEGTKLRGALDHDGARVEVAEPTSTVAAGGTSGVEVPPGGVRVTFPAPITGASVRLYTQRDAVVEGRSGDSLVTSVKVTASPAVQHVDVPGMSLSTIAVDGDGAVLVEVCGRRTDEHDRIF